MGDISEDIHFHHSVYDKRPSLYSEISYEPADYFNQNSKPHFLWKIKINSNINFIMNSLKYHSVLIGNLH